MPDNALAESTIGLFKTEAVTRNSPFHQGPFKTIADIEFATMGWIDWYNNRRLHATLGLIPPQEFEGNYYAQHPTSQPEMSPHEAGKKSVTVQTPSTHRSRT